MVHLGSLAGSRTVATLALILSLMIATCGDGEEPAQFHEVAGEV